MDQVRIGVIGVGNMGSAHAAYLVEGSIKGACLGALLEEDGERASAVQQHFGDNVPVFTNESDFFRTNVVDAVLIATPHYSHSRLAEQAFAAGLHVLCEKPAGVYTRQVREMNEAAQKSGRVYSLMYNQRTKPIYLKLKDLIQSGELGTIRRMNWIITDWYRSQSYYDSSSWRATWPGEGGGVLINQCPHQLDLWGWLIGMEPNRIRAFCSFGKYRDIEVEDEVTAYMEYESGATGVFITTTAEAPGTNRLEVTGTKGKAVIEGETLSFWQLRTPEPAFNASYKGGFGAPEHWKIDIPVAGAETGHQGITQNFVDAILHGVPLIAPGEEGIQGLTLSNAMHLSTWIDNWVELPLNEALYEQNLNERIRNSPGKTVTTNQTLDVRKSY
ncbi:Gfo/Idh/MocA family protein [Shouchella rhizosphaerae]|uniref:Gfo/Idh/MocA family protein n=1 Tax=Shouchella rhizosphaerae TaxID=866786 RepID=UPI002041929F|nr:Gfo/Idh/MocA family oxidoreductase [Shouchella rhizosphaerae]MCM3378382.1 Gfo/Idh/MocA family oxidoreductase [Shouchella rhizosphaerae]